MRSSRGWVGLSQMFRLFEANSGTIERKGSKDLAKSSTLVVDQSYLGQAPKRECLGCYVLLNRDVVMVECGGGDEAETG